MADQEAKDAAARNRIISHMNADHHDSVIRYLEHYHKVPSYTAYTGKISAVTLSEISMSCAGKTYRVPFEPPMTSFREARERVVELDKECVAALGRSDITVREFVPPYGLYLASFVVICVTLVSFSFRSNFAPDSTIAGLIPDGFCRFCWAIQPYLFYPMVILHAAEMVTMGRGRLVKHNVNMKDPIYWQWLGTTFIEGIGSFNRFDKMIARKKIEKDRQKH